MAGSLALSPAATLHALAQATGATPAAADVPLAPLLILVLCAVAGVGTVLLLPARREAALRKVGGAIVLVAFLILAAMLIHHLSALGRGRMSVYFWVFSAIAVFGAVRVITHPRPVYSALYFVLSVMATAGLFILLWAEFMAAALIVIYAGAILVTYVFVIMLATQSAMPGAAAASTNGEVGGIAEYDAVSREPVVASAIGFTLMGVLLFVIFDRAPQLPVGAVTTVTASSPELAPSGPNYPPGSVQALGVYLFKSQMVNLELAGLILTIAMVGAILIARRRVLVPARTGAPAEVLVGPATPIDDNPHSIPVYGTDNPRAKAYPQT
jgi:NADH-quinone oxidoreductase subunit J